MVLGGDALPVMNTLAEFQAFDATVTTDVQVTSGPFAPGAIIPFDVPAGTVTTPNAAVSGNDTLNGGAGDDLINSGTNDGSIGDYIDGSTGNDTILYTDSADGWQVLSYDSLTAGITASIDAGLNTASINKGANGTDTIVDIAVPLTAGWFSSAGGFSLRGTTFDDPFNITQVSERWMQVAGLQGNDTYNLQLDGGIVRVDYRQGANGINVNLATGVVSNDGFGSVDQINVVNNGGQLEIRGTNFDDTIVDGAANERFILKSGNDTLDGGGGNDLLRYDRGGVSHGVTVDLTAGTANGTWDGAVFTHTITGIEHVRGARAGNDMLAGDAFANTLDGRGGNDTFIVWSWR